MADTALRQGAGEEVLAACSFAFGMHGLNSAALGVSVVVSGAAVLTTSSMCPQQMLLLATTSVACGFVGARLAPPCYHMMLALLRAGQPSRLKPPKPTKADPIFASIPAPLNIDELIQCAPLLTSARSAVATALLNELFLAKEVDTLCEQAEKMSALYGLQDASPAAVEETLELLQVLVFPAASPTAAPWARVLVARGAESLYVVFQGREAHLSWGDLLADVTALNSAHGTSADFANMAITMFASILEATVRHRRSADTPIVFTGHASGGAAALLAFLRYCTQVTALDPLRHTCILFGQPHVGGVNYQHELYRCGLHTKVLSICHAADPTLQLPLSACKLLRLALPTVTIWSLAAVCLSPVRQGVVANILRTYPTNVQDCLPFLSLVMVVPALRTLLSLCRTLRPGLAHIVDLMPSTRVLVLDDGPQVGVHMVNPMSSAPARFPRLDAHEMGQLRASLLIFLQTRCHERFNFALDGSSMSVTEHRTISTMTSHSTGATAIVNFPAASLATRFSAKDVMSPFMWLGSMGLALCYANRALHAVADLSARAPPLLRLLQAPWCRSALSVLGIYAAHAGQGLVLAVESRPRVFSTMVAADILAGTIWYGLPSSWLAERMHVMVVRVSAMVLPSHADSTLQRWARVIVRKALTSVNTVAAIFSAVTVSLPIPQLARVLALLDALMAPYQNFLSALWNRRCRWRRRRELWVVSGYAPTVQLVLFQAPFLHENGEIQVMAPGVPIRPVTLTTGAQANLVDLTSCAIHGSPLERLVLQQADGLLFLLDEDKLKDEVDMLSHLLEVLPRMPPSAKRAVLVRTSTKEAGKWVSMAEWLNTTGLPARAPTAVAKLRELYAAIPVGYLGDPSAVLATWPQRHLAEP